MAFPGDLFLPFRPRFFLSKVPAAAPQAILSAHGGRKYGERTPIKGTRGSLNNPSPVPTADMIWLLKFCESGISPIVTLYGF